MSQERVALIVDHPQRDLAGLVLTAFELCQRGIACHLVPLNLQHSELWALAPDFVLLNYLRRFNEPVVRQLAEAGIQYGLLDTEGAVFSGPDEYAELHCEDEALLRGASCVCMWGPKLADYLVARGSYTSEQISVTGCPRFDLYAPGWREAIWDAAPRNGGPAHILINTNFSIVNPRFTSSAQNIEYYHEQLGWTREHLAEFTGRETVAINEMIGMARSLAGRFPESRVVVRVHPHEDPAPYHDGLRGIENVEVNDRGPVQAQLFRASVVVQRSCTTAIESALVGAPTLSPRWVTPPMEAPMAEAVSLGCRSLEKLSDCVDDILGGRYQPSAEHERNVAAVLEEWFHVQDGMAFRRVADAVTAALRPRTADERVCERFLYLNAYLPEGRVQRAARYARLALGLSPDWSFLRMRSVPSNAWESSDKVFTAEEVRALVARMDGVYREKGWPVRPVSVTPARESGDYLRKDYRGHSVTLACV
jgi:surface carbohydrate biosynthesis protein